jgi:hypothetical protein
MVTVRDSFSLILGRTDLRGNFSPRPPAIQEIEAAQNSPTRRQLTPKIQLQANNAGEHAPLHQLHFLEKTLTK